MYYLFAGKFSDLTNDTRLPRIASLIYGVLSLSSYADRLIAPLFDAKFCTSLLLAVA